jgi:hypothetical protein
MQGTEFRIRESSWLAALAARKLGVPSVAITIGRTIHLHRANRRDLLQNSGWLRHELKHVEQFRRYGLLPFIGLYLLESLRKGYHENRFEREAREAEQDRSYDPLYACADSGRGLFNPVVAGKATPVVQRQTA